MTIKNRNLTVGMVLVSKYHKNQHKCQVVQGEGGKLRYRLTDGREFKSPSAAGMAITGHAADGWVFWSVETAANAPVTENQTEVTNPPTEVAAKVAVSAEIPETGNAPPIAAAPATVEANTAKKSFFRTPNQKGVIDGHVKWYCKQCGESFLAPYGEIPMACPQGHKA